MSDNHNFQRLKKNQSKKRKSAKWTPYSSKYIRLYQKQINKTQLSFETNGNDIVPDEKKQKKIKRNKKGKRGKKKLKTNIKQS